MNIIYCKKEQYPYFEEYLKCFEIFGIKIVKYKLGEINDISTDNFNIFIRMIPDKYIDFAKCFINTEQLTNDSNTKIIKKCIEKKILIIDYSYENISYLKKIFLNYNKIFYFPYLFMNCEYEKLKKLTSEQKIYDVVFCGSLTERRKNIINLLKKKIPNINIKIVDKLWNDDRDKLIAKSKILLNIHAYDDFNIYESIRCDRWIFSNLLVITENSIGDDFNDLKDLLIITKYDNIAEKVIEVLNNYQKYYENYSNNYQTIIPTIIKNRYDLADNIIKEFICN